MKYFVIFQIFIELFILSLIVVLLSPSFFDVALKTNIAEFSMSYGGPSRESITDYGSYFIPFFAWSFIGVFATCTTVFVFRPYVEHSFRIAKN